MRENEKRKRKKKKKNQQKITWVARSTFGFPFSNKIWTICSCPSSTAIERGVLPAFTLKKK